MRHVRHVSCKDLASLPYSATQNRPHFPLTPLDQDGLDEAARIAAAAAVAIKVLPHAGGCKAVVARGKSGMIRLVDLPGVAPAAGGGSAAKGGAAAMMASGVRTRGGGGDGGGSDQLARVEASLAVLYG